MSRARRTLEWPSRLAAALIGVTLLSTTVAAGALTPTPRDDGVYGRFEGDTDLSLKLGGMLSGERWSGSVGVSAHYYSLIGATADYSESFVADAQHARSFALGAELRPLFLPRWALGFERGPAWLDLTIDSASVGFGAYFADPRAGADSTRGLWLSLGAGVPLLARATGPWFELRYLRRFPDPGERDERAHNAVFLYLSWHQFIQLRPDHPSP